MSRKRKSKKGSSGGSGLFGDKKKSGNSIAKAANPRRALKLWRRTLLLAPFPFLRWPIFIFLLILPILFTIFFIIAAVVVMSGLVTVVVAVDEEFDYLNYEPSRNMVVDPGNIVSPDPNKGYVPPHLEGELLFPTYGRFTSAYGMRVLRGNRSMHWGIDIAPPVAGQTGIPIYPITSGEVVRVSYCSGSCNTGWGNYVTLKHDVDGELYHSLYAHLDSIDVREGDILGFNDRLGIMGTTGNSTGIHLHLEIYKGEASHGNTNINPLHVLTCDHSGPFDPKSGINVQKCWDYRNSMVGGY